MNREIIYLGHNNSVDLLLKADGSAEDLSSVTSMTLTVNGAKVSSTSSSAGPIRWSGGTLDTGEVQLHLGDEALDVGTYDCPLIAYDSTNTEGVVWGDVPLKVTADVEGA